MAIELIVQDQIDGSIETKLRAAAKAAAALDKNVSNLQKTLSGLNTNGLSDVANKLASSYSSGSGKSGASKTFESAAVTQQKKLEATRKEISKVFEDGFKQREKQNAATIAAFNKSEAAFKAASEQQAKRVASVEKASVTAAKNLQKTRNEIASVFTNGFAERTTAAYNFAQSISRNQVAPKNLRKYIDDVVANSKPSSVAVRQGQQQLYDSLFGAHNITTSASNAWQSQLNSMVASTKPSTAAAKAAQQNVYNSLFGAGTGTTLTTSSTNAWQSKLNNMVMAAKATPKAGQQSQQAMYNSLFNAVPTQQLAAVSTGIGKVTTAHTKWTQAAINNATAMERLNSSVSFLRSDGLRWAKVLWALGGATLTAGAIVAAADAYTRLQNRLSVVADSQQQVNYLTGEMLRISTASRQPIEETAKTFTRLDLAMQQAGRSQQDTMRLTENIAKALKLGGATAGEAASAMLQLSQAFNKGKLDGDEFRSMMENSPILADALAKSLKVTRGELLKLAPEGKITAKVMADAWIGATEDINKAFAELRPTIAESFTELRSTMTVFFGELDKQIGFTAGLANAIMFVADNLDVLTFAVLAVTPLLATFVGAQVLAGLSTFMTYTARTAMTIGAMRSPITIVATAMAGMIRNSTAAGASMIAAFTNANTRALMLQMTVVRLAASVAGLANVARAAGAAMLSMFSFGNLLLVLSVAVAAAIAFGDQLIVNAEKGTTMRDYTIAAFQEIGAFAKDVFITIYDAVAESFGGQVDESQTFGEKVGDVFFKVGLAAAVTVDAISTVFTNLWNGVKSVVYLIGDAIYNTVALMGNAIVSLVNGAIDQINTLTAGANSILEWTGMSNVVGTFGQLGHAAGFAYKDQFLQSLGDFGVKTDAADAYMLFADNVRTRAGKIGEERGKTPPPPRSTTPAASTVDPDKKGKGKGKGKDGKSDGEKRADIIAKVVNAETSAIEVAKRYGDERERLNVIEELNNKLKQKGYAQLSEGANGERQMIDTLVQQRIEAERVGEAMQSMYENSVKPEQDRQAGMKAAELLMNAGAISAGEYASNVARLADEFRSATDTAYDLWKQFDQLAELQGLTGDARSNASAVYDARKNAESKGLTFTDADVAKVIEYQNAITDLQRRADAAESITAKTTTALTENQYALNAMSEAYKAGAVSVGMYRQEIAGLLAEQGRLGEQTYGLSMADPFEPMRRGMYQLVAEMPSLGQGMADAISSTLGSAIDNVSNTLTDMILNFDAYAEKVADALDRPVSTLDVMRYALADIINQIGKQLIAAVIKLGIQMAIQAAMGRAMETAASAATVATQTATASAVSAAWTPAAMSASIATMGGAAATGLSGFMMAQAAGKAISFAGAFKDGGILGGMGTGRSDSTLFMGSRGEMVMNRDAVAANQPLLHAMNSGAKLNGAGYVDNSVHVNITYNTDGTKTSSGTDNELSRDLVRFIDARVAKGVQASQKQGKQGY